MSKLQLKIRRQKCPDEVFPVCVLKKEGKVLVSFKIYPSTVLKMAHVMARRQDIKYPIEKGFKGRKYFYNYLNDGLKLKTLDTRAIARLNKKYKIKTDPKSRKQ